MRIAVVGAGISGLALTWYLKKRISDNDQLFLYEQNHRAGGWVRSFQQDGFLFEVGPRSFRSKGNGQATLELVEALGLQEEVIEAASTARQRYLLYKGSLRKISVNPFSFLFSPLLRSVLPALVHDFFTSPCNKEDESIYSFISRRVSPKIAERFVDPMVSGIFAGDIKQLSIKSCLPYLYQCEQRHGSIVKGMLKRRAQPQSAQAWVKAKQKAPLLTFKQGMETLVRALANNLSPHLEYQQRVTSLKITKDAVLLCLNHNRIEKVERLYLALPPQAVVEFLAPFLSVPSIESTSLAVINLGWKERQLKKEGFGYLIPSAENEKLLGMVWDSSAFPEQNQSSVETRLTAMLGGVHHQSLLELSDEQLLQIALEGVKRHLGISQPPFSRHLSRALEAVPQYKVGHAKQVELFEKELAQLTSGRISVIGSAWHGIGVNDCIHNAALLALNFC